MGKLTNILAFIVIITVFLVATKVILDRQREITFLSVLNILEIPKEKTTEKLPGTNWQWIDDQKKLYELTPTEIDLILKELWERFPNKEDRLKALAILRLGTPYQLGCLGEESGIDKDPIFRLDVTDCTVFVLTNVALLHSQTLEEAKEMMEFLNYRPNSKITFENRLHFTTDRNITSPYFQDITEQVAGLSRTKEKEVVLNKIKADGKRLIDIDWKKEMVVKHIPNKYITKDLLSKLPQAVGIAFIREGDEEIGLDVRHEGFLFAGELLFHAPSVGKKVVAKDFFEYYFGEDQNPRFDGIILFEIKWRDLNAGDIIGLQSLYGK